MTSSSSKENSRSGGGGGAGLWLGGTSRLSGGVVGSSAIRVAYLPILPLRFPGVAVV
jgi:hypothetical protein